MYASGYTLDLYCENIDNKELDLKMHDWLEFPHTFFAYDRKQAFRDARKAGWKINTKNKTCICPKCVQKLPNYIL